MKNIICLSLLVSCTLVDSAYGQATSKNAKDNPNRHAFVWGIFGGELGSYQEAFELGEVEAGSRHEIGIAIHNNSDEPISLMSPSIAGAKAEDLPKEIKIDSNGARALRFFVETDVFPRRVEGSAVAYFADENGIIFPGFKVNWRYRNLSSFASSELVDTAEFGSDYTTTLELLFSDEKKAKNARVIGLKEIEFLQAAVVKDGTKFVAELNIPQARLTGNLKGTLALVSSNGDELDRIPLSIQPKPEVQISPKRTIVVRSDGTPSLFETTIIVTPNRKGEIVSKIKCSIPPEFGEVTDTVAQPLGKRAYKVKVIFELKPKAFEKHGGIPCDATIELSSKIEKVQWLIDTL